MPTFMKKLTLLLFLMILGLGVVNASETNISNAITNGTAKNINPAEEWSEDQFYAYNDSLLRALYPEVRECHYQDTIQKDSNPVIPQGNGTPDYSSGISNSIVPDIVHVDKSKAVGEIEIKSGVTPMGAKTYEVPIKVYPGINNFQPNISLVYCSLSDNSIAGQGWSLSGIPVITRGGKNPFHDNKREGMQMDNSDSFYIDGTRLIRTDSLTSGCIIYESEQGNIRATGYISGSVMKYFKVSYPDGSTAQFGYDTNSENKITYPITSISDIHENTATYSYNYIDNYYFISRIEYNGASIEFAYKTRTDYITSYPYGNYTAIRKCLASITCRHNGQALGSYSLTHTLHNNVSHLSSIEYNSGQDSFNPIHFIYGNGNTIEDYTTSSTQLLKWYDSEDRKMIKIIKGRFDYGNTNDGLIVLPNYNTFWYLFQHRTAFRKETNKIKNLYKGNEKIFIYAGLSDNFATPMNEIVTGNGFVDIFCADLTGKQEEYLVKVNNQQKLISDQLSFTVYRPNPYSGLQQLYTRTYNFYPTQHIDEYGIVSLQPKFFYTGDFTGNGKMEVLSVGMHNPCGDEEIPTICHLFDLENDTILYTGRAFDFKILLMGTNVTDEQYAKNNSDRIFVFDADGDGKTDICHINETGCHTYTFEISDDGSLDLRLIGSYTNPSRSWLTDKELFLGELNGDGLVDMIATPKRGKDTTNWTTYYSRGDGKFISSTSEGPANPSEENTGFIIQDIDCDGRTDIIKYDTFGFDTFPSMPGYTGNTGFRTIFDKDNSILVPTNINSLNTFSQLLCLNNGVVTKYAYQKNKSKERLLTGMVNSLGVIERNEYQSLCESTLDDPVYTYINKTVYPYISIREPMMVLARTETLIDGNVYDENSYTYENAVFHRMGLGFQGFEKVTSTDVNGNITISTYDPYNFGVQKSVVTPSFETSINYSIDINPRGIRKILIDTKTEKNRLTGYSANWSYTYDQYGFPLTETVTYSDGIEIRKETTYDTNPDDKYNVGFSTDVKVTTTNGSGQYEERIHFPEFEYRHPNIAIKYVNGNQVERTDYTYDSYGNIVEKRVKSYESSDVLPYAYTYTADGLLSEEIDPMGLSSQYTYNSKGLVSTSTDCRGNVSTLEYDTFGRETKICFPDGTEHAVTYAWETTDNGGLYSVSEIQTGEPDVKRYFDAFNREVRTEETRFDGSTIKTDREYDYKGNLIAESMPYKSGSPSLWTTFDYDQYDRLVCRTEPTGRQISYTYSGSSVTEDDGIKSKTCDYDSAGNLISVSDSEGIIDFILGADGQKESIVIDDGSGTDCLNTTYGYDRYRRVTSVNDPSQGETLTEYDESGNIASQTDANGETVSFEHDIYGRVTKKIFPEFETTYTYNDYNELVARNSTNGTFKHFSFDGLGRLVSEKEGGVGAWLQKDYTYADGNVETITYTSNHGKLTTETYAYANGHLKEVKISDGQSIYRLEEENSLGKPTRAVTGSITRHYGYDQYGFPTDRSAETEDRIYQDESYEFDPLSSNLVTRYENISGQYEGFGYDGQNRLTCFGGEAVTYHSNGSISDKSDAGVYEYETPGKPYAVSGITPHYNGEFPQKEQDIEYTSFSRPASISEDGTSASFQYNADGDRVRMFINKGKRECLERHYLGGCYECDNVGAMAYNYIEKLYLMGDFYSAPSVLLKSPYELQKADTIPMQMPDSLIHMPVDPIPADPLQPYRSLGIGDNPNMTLLDYFSSGKPHKSGVHQILRDYLGSITHVIQPDGTEVENLGYDAWGRVRLPEEDGRYMSGTDPPLYLGRGYTGHEHLPLFGLVNMNARLYDPLLGRFLSPDPYVAFSDWLQSYNRYSYVLNNPFCYIDQDGEFIWFIVGAAIVGAVINVGINWDDISSSSGWSVVGKIAGYAFTGAVAGGVSAFVGVTVAGALGGSMMGVMAGTTGFINGTITGASMGASSGFILGTGNSLMTGDSFGNALIGGFKQGAVDGLVGGMTGGVNGGIKALNRSRNFWTGKYSNRMLVQRAATNAEKYIGGKGHVAGSKKHKYATDVLKRYQRMVDDRRLEFGVSSDELVKKKLYSGRKLILDVLDRKHKMIYDWKFGYPGKTPFQLNQSRQMQRYRDAWHFQSTIIMP